MANREESVVGEEVGGGEEEVERKKARRGHLCAVYGCDNRPDIHRDISVHAFPRRKRERDLWMKFVQTCRADFHLSTIGTQGICSAHFEPTCFPQSVGLMRSFGLQAQKNLIAGSIPTIQKPVTVTMTTTTITSASTSSIAATVPSSSASSRPIASTSVRSAFQKREHARVCILFCFH